MKGKWRYKMWSIGAKAMSGFVLLALVVTCLAGALTYQLGYRYMRDVSLRELLQHTKQIAQWEAQRYRRLELPTQENMKIYQKLSDALVFFVDTDYVAVRVSEDEDGAGTTQVPEDTMRTQIINVLDQQFVARILMGETVTEARRFEFANGEVLFAGVPLMNPYNEIIGGVILVQPIEKFLDLWSVLRTVLVLSAIIALLLAVLLAWKLSRTLTKPLVQMTQAARRMGEGEYRTRVDVQSSDELGELGSTLNMLSARLGDVIERLKEERDQLETIIGSIGEGIVAVDSSGHVVRYNQAFLELTEIGGMEALEEDDGVELKELRALLRDCMFSRKRQRGRWVNPSERNLLAIASPLFGKKREILGGVALVQDVSESERLEQLRRDYVANVSHELRTPLTGIRGMVEPLMDGYMDTEEEKADCYRVIYKETLRLEKLITEMLDVSRLQDGREKVETEPLDVRGIVLESLRRVRPTAEAAGVKLSARLPDEELNCLGNEDRILQVLTIFLDNALSFTPTGGNVTAYAENVRGSVRIGVIDTGVGIEAKDLPFIWERFYKSDKSRMRTSGTGLGLAIAKLVVELMGGEIGVDSQPGKGAEFYFILKKE